LKELAGKLAEVEGEVSAFLGKLEPSLMTIKGDLETVDQGPLSALDTVLATVEDTRAFLLSKLAEVEGRAASLRPD